MQIIFLARRYAPHVGGVENHLQYLNQQLLQSSKKKQCITVITEQYEFSLPPSEINKGVHIKRIPLPSGETNKLAIWRWIFAHRDLFFSADIIHVHDVFFWVLPLYPWLRLLNKKIFITFHGYEGPGNPTWRQRAWHQLAAILAGGNICIGGFHQKWYGVQPTMTSFGAVEISKQKTRQSADQTLTRILYLGRLSADIGIMKYLAAVKELATTENLALDVYGDGPDWQAAQTFVSKHHLPVIFHGFIPSNKIRWQDYDVAFVSGYLSILEAMSAGLPVIAQYHAPIKYDYLKDTPFANWIVIAGSVEEIVAGWQQVISLKYSSNIKLGQAWAKKQTWQKLANQYLALWQRN